MIIRGKEIRWKPLVLALCAFCWLHPYYVWSTSQYFLMGVIPALYLAVILPNVDIKSNNKSSLFLFFFILFLVLCFIQGYSLSFSLYTISLVFVPFIKKELINDTLQYFSTILGFILAGALVFWLLTLINVSLPSHYLAPLNEEFVEGYTAFPPFLVRLNNIMDFARFCGPFDEPGVVGTVCLILLFIDDYNLKKWYNVVFLISGLCAASFVFVSGSLIFLCFFVLSKNIRIGFLALIVVLLFYFFTKDSLLFQTLFYDRMEFDATTGKFAGDNRFSDNQLEYVSSIFDTQLFWFGDHGASEGMFTGSRSILDAILSYGALFCILYFVFYLLYAISHNISRRSLFLFIFVLCLILYQRPLLVHFTYLFLFSSYVQNRTDERLENRNS